MAEVVILQHKTWQPGKGPPVVKVRDQKTGELLFEDTIPGTADWLDMFGYQWNGLTGIWSCVGSR